LSDKYNKLEVSHIELGVAYEKLRKTVELLAHDDAVNDENEEDEPARRRSSRSNTFRSLLEIIHGDAKGVTQLKPEST
jgi:hypothetical protein